jgi:hypothetical protein
MMKNNHKNEKLNNLKVVIVKLPKKIVKIPNKIFRIIKKCLNNN